MEKVKFFGIMALSLLLISGCSTPEQRLARALKGIEDKPSEFQDGYADGCKSAFFAAGEVKFQYTKDLQQFDSNQMYMRGWNDGFNICQARKSQERHSADSGSSVIYLPSKKK